MLLYIDEVPHLVQPLKSNPLGFVRVFEQNTRNYLATLPARFIRNKIGSLAYNGKTYRWPNPIVKAGYIGDTLYMEGPHNYAYYYVPDKRCWKESASISNETLVKSIKEAKQNDNLKQY